MNLLRLFTAIGILVTLCACQTVSNQASQQLGNISLSPWPWAPIKCFGCDWQDQSLNTPDGKITKTEARKSGERIIVAAKNDAGGDIMPGFSIRGVASENRFNISFANSYRDASVTFRDNHGQKRTLNAGQHSPVTINNETWMIYIVRASQWQDGNATPKYLIDWVLLKMDQDT